MRETRWRLASLANIGPSLFHQKRTGQHDPRQAGLAGSRADRRRRTLTRRAEGGMPERLKMI